MKKEQLIIIVIGIAVLLYLSKQEALASQPITALPPTIPLPQPGPISHQMNVTKSLDH